MIFTATASTLESCNDRNMTQHRIPRPNPQTQASHSLGSSATTSGSLPMQSLPPLDARTVAAVEKYLGEYWVTHQLTISLMTYQFILIKIYLNFKVSQVTGWGHFIYLAQGGCHTLENFFMLKARLKWGNLITEQLKDLPDESCFPHLASLLIRNEWNLFIYEQQGILFAYYVQAVGPKTYTGWKCQSSKTALQPLYLLIPRKGPNLQVHELAWGCMLA